MSHPLFNADHIYECSSLPDFIHLASPTCTTQIVSHTQFNSYQAWAEKSASAFEELVILHNISTRFLSQFYTQLFKPPPILIITGKAELFTYIWPNGEPKTIICWNKTIISRSSHWLRSYPFLSLDTTLSRQRLNVYRVQKNYNSQIASLPVEDEKTFSVLLSHNNHYGHFLLDDLPLLGLASYLHPQHTLLAIDHNIKTSILDTLHTLTLDKVRAQAVCDKYSDSQSEAVPFTANLNILHSNKHIEIVCSSPYLRAYVFQLLFSPYLSNQPSTRRPKKVFLSRKGIYGSRISNYEEVEAFLLRNKFLVIDPSQYPLVDLLQMIYGSEIIVTECGSTCLNALLFSSNATRVIALVPRRLVQEPTQTMLLGGLPYLFCYPHKLSLVTGDTIKTHDIQSSDIVHYSLCDIDQAL